MTLNIINIVSTWACLFIGMMSLNLSMDKPFKDIFNRKLNIKQMYGLRVFGWSALLISVSAAIAAWGMSIGLAAWFGIATFMVGILIYIQSYQPKWVWYMTLTLSIFVIILQLFRFFN